MRKGYGLGDADGGSIEERVTVYGSSRNCYEQLREAIRESLAKQNLLHFPSETGRTSPNCGSLGTICSVSESKKVKMPNVVARLMGLEELPSYDQGREKPCRSDQRLEMQRKPTKWGIEERELPPKSRRRIQEGDDCSTKLVFTTDMAVPRLYQPYEESTGPRRRELEKIIGSVQLTDILKNRVSHGKDFPRSGLVNPVASTLYGEKMKMGGAKLQEIPPIVIIKPMVISKTHSKDLEKGKMFRELEELLQNGKKQKAEIFNKPGSVKSTMLNGSVKSQKEEICNKPRKKQTSLENQGRKIMVFSTSLAEKPRNKSSLRKEPVERCARRSKSESGLPDRELINFSDRIRNGKEKEKAVLAPKHKASSKCIIDVTLNPTREEAPSSAVTGCPSLHQLRKQDLMDCTRKQLKGMSKTEFRGSPVENEHKSLHGTRTMPITKANEQDHDALSVDCIISGRKNEVKHLLLNNSSFLSAAQECFDIDMTSSACPMNYKEFDASSKKIIMDFVLEVLTHKFRKTPLQRVLIKNPYLQNQKEIIFLDALVEELCHDLENLLNYQIMDEFRSNDNVYVIIKRDLLCRQIDISCMWDFGWENAAIAEHLEVLFSQLEMYVLGRLIKETVEEMYGS